MTLPQLNLDNYQGPIAEMTTNFGVVRIALFPEQAPKTVANFTQLADQGYYNGLIFHWVIPDFMVQGGDPTGTGMGGESVYGAPFADEFSNELFNIRGALSMANAGPNTNGSQFFIVQNQHLDQQFASQMRAAGYPEDIAQRYLQEGGTPWLDHHHTVFGQVMTGMGVIDSIAAVKTNNADKPLEDVTLDRVDIIRAD
ncbi:peptidylprolyl isomerase [Lacticaseibacillus thailandensis]|uniref:Peptidyl-prolyl cis-trans isomerase n=1 Tax=Lacticaseibacillus thailandensis DSM 22698 = JCM 13996 TaxID=1423810 RepID=A0A0R2CIA5_9LACO|nr:peptidylprolyl isomerase [Lacticaseibacillus thailandensis]KRM87766.1 peptidyl-prolyl cis-trans isomerase [Lacticaseibacillus thailandensis DSM 22698 = JCM 13996]